jgi:predicted ATPase/DNA-binding winged helix-turn-helix (wHTH) protein
LVTRIHFDRFSLDLANECLWKGTESIKLRPKAFAVLEYLLGRPGQLVTKEHLISAVWQDTFVGDAVLKVTIQQIREALADDPKAPRFIETAHRRGYRFIGRIDAGPPAAVEAPAAVPRGFVGRGAALSRVHDWLARMRRGERQVVFVTGEAGIGKTTLLDTFTRGLAGDRSLRICAGQCLEQYGMCEAYLPVMEAIRQLCREHAEVVEVLRAHAPMWLLQMPSLVTASDRETFGREAFGATRERMLREMGDALDALTAHTPLVLVLEDLHWSDYSTLDLISYLARPRRAAHLMVIGTYRPAELIASGHPLKAVKQELLAKQQCEELPLEYLDEDAVAQYLAVRFAANRFPGALAALIHERTEGNPLFMVNTVDYLVSEGLIAEQDGAWQMTTAIDTIKVGVPDSIRHLIEKQIDRLDAREQRLLEAASVAGAEFSAASLAAGLGERTPDVEVRCEALGRRNQFLRDCGVQVLPNGEAVGRYGFVHAVYRHVLYDRVAAARRIVLHRRIAEGGEALYGDRTREIAAELAMHFERSANHQHAAHYSQQAAENAMHRSAYREAIALSRHGLELLATLPDSPARARQELLLLITLGVPLIATEGYAAPTVGHVYRQARAICDRLGDAPEISQVLWGLWTFHVLRAELSTALDIAAEFLRLDERGPEDGFAMLGHWSMEITFTHLGEFARAIEHFDQAVALYQPDEHRDSALLYALNPGVAMRCFGAWSLWFAGRPDRALARVSEAVVLARELTEPHGLAHALVSAALLHQLRREHAMAFEHAEEAIALTTEHGLVLYQAMAAIARGWALIGRQPDAETIEQMNRGIAAWQTTGALLMRPHYQALLAEALTAAGRHDEALHVLDDALVRVESAGERCYQAELYRLKGELLRAGDPGDAEACFEQSLAAARRQQALSLELRTAMSLLRLHRGGPREAASRDRLAAIYAQFAEGLDTPDLRDARALIDEIRAPRR